MIPWTLAFFSWYMLYVFCSMWAPDFMSKQIVGNINVALVFGLLQFVFHLRDRLALLAPRQP